jgi:hypothetical protein
MFDGNRPTARAKGSSSAMAAVNVAAPIMLA